MMIAVMRVLLVEDSEEVRRRLCSLLSEIPGARLAGEAARVLEAISLLHRCKPDLLILDLGLSDGSGLEVLEELPGPARPPCVIVLTNLTDAAYRDRCAQLGVSHFLSKSREIETLRKLLVNLADEFSEAKVAN